MEIDQKNYVWDVPVNLSPNAINYLLSLLMREEENGPEPWDVEMVKALLLLLLKVRAKLYRTKGEHKDG